MSDGKDNGGIVGTDKGGKPKSVLKNSLRSSKFLPWEIGVSDGTLEIGGTETAGAVWRDDA